MGNSKLWISLQPLLILLYLFFEHFLTTRKWEKNINGSKLWAIKIYPISHPIIQFFQTFYFTIGMEKGWEKLTWLKALSQEAIFNKFLIPRNLLKIAVVKVVGWEKYRTHMDQIFDIWESKFWPWGWILTQLGQNWGQGWNLTPGGQNWPPPGPPPRGGGPKWPFSTHFGTLWAPNLGPDPKGVKIGPRIWHWSHFLPPRGRFWHPFYPLPRPQKVTFWPPRGQFSRV